ncbi:MAG: rod shape-determining protein MreC [Halobacteriovoraceae bacterium]|nr:rod shape-determining protein MreC [Halobacteriovoraceae bacterium]|tara:strand:- start:2181 stop:3083 length:903 start_codon:yes stop_codon:yes gene_type:complete
MNFKEQKLNTFSFDSSRWKLVCNVIVVGISLYGIATQKFTLKENTLFEKVFTEMVAPIQEGTMSVKDSIAQTFDRYIFIVNTRQENERLKNNLDKLQNEIFSLKEVKKENERLKKLLDFGKDIERRKVLAQIVARDSSSEFKVLRINKGESHGLKLLSPVITQTGLVGYVYRLSPNYADILTILDQNNRVDAIVSRTRTHGILEGRSGFTCQFKYVSRTEKLELKDEIITAGLGEIYPKGIKIGTITKIDKESFGITQKIEVTPSVDFDKLEEVVVLLDPEGSTEKPDEIMSLSVEEPNE